MPITFARPPALGPTPKFIAKLGIVEQELDETLLWFELLMESKTVTDAKLQPLHQEAEELLKIVVTAVKRTKGQA